MCFEGVSGEILSAWRKTSDQALELELEWSSQISLFNRDSSLSKGEDGQLLLLTLQLNC